MAAATSVRLQISPQPDFRSLSAATRTIGFFSVQKNEKKNEGEILPILFIFSSSSLTFICVKESLLQKSKRAPAVAQSLEAFARIASGRSSAAGTFLFLTLISRPLRSFYGWILNIDPSLFLFFFFFRFFALYGWGTPSVHVPLARP